MQKIPVERARELYNQERDKIITTTEYIAEIVKECFLGLVVRCTNHLGGGSGKISRRKTLLNKFGIVLRFLLMLALLAFAVDQVFIVMEHPEWLGWGIFFGVSSLIIFIGMIYGFLRGKYGQ
jgi:hypothetical protein